jgi:hypothetical protein
VTEKETGERRGMQERLISLAPGSKTRRSNCLLRNPASSYPQRPLAISSPHPVSLAATTRKGTMPTMSSSCHDLQVLITNKDLSCWLHQ